MSRTTLSSTPAGTTIGRKESECGQIGVTIIAGTDGWIIEAPAATAYAVLPVGVDTINPTKKYKCNTYSKLFLLKLKQSIICEYLKNQIQM